MGEVDRIEELKVKRKEIDREIDLLKGRRGICSRCKEEGEYAHWSEDEPLICLKCYNEEQIAKAREKYIHLIGLKVEDVIIVSGLYPFQGLKLEGGYIIEVVSDHEGDAYLDIEQEKTVYSKEGS